MSDTWCIDPQKVETAITDKTKAIMATHLYGNLCNMDALLAIGDKYEVPVIEDAQKPLAPFIKSRVDNGFIFDIFVHGTKTLTTGEGGMF